MESQESSGKIKETKTLPLGALSGAKKQGVAK